jgi:parallel beta-helix repeat protein
MRMKLAAPASLLGLTSALPVARAADHYASPTGSGDCSQSSPCSIGTASRNAQPGDTVYLRGGRYGGTLNPANSGSSGAWITYRAYPGELPIFDGGQSGGTGVGSSSVQYVRFVGIASRNFSSTGFGNGWTDSNCSQMSNGNLQFINCVADGNGINGIAFYCASGLLIEQSIVAHNGNMDPSWSSGVNLFHVTGSYQDNIVRQTVSFENIDISSNRSDGSGFILDQNSSGGTFENNIGFRNGGSCIRLTNSSNGHLINNTCVGNGVDPNVQYHDEIFYSDSNSRQGAVLRNNLTVPTSGQRGLAMGEGVTAENNLFEGTSSLLLSTTGGLDFHLQSSASQAIDTGSSNGAPSTDIGFDPRCIKQQGGQAVSWWQYAVDYDYIESIGGVAACFNPGTRRGAPDIGAYEYGASASATGGATGTGGGSSAGGTDGATGGGGTSCSDPLTLCGESCVDLSSDPNHCGSCGNVCGSAESCEAGVCTAVSACQEPLVQCGDSCVDLASNALNCGDCGITCAENEVCSAGACASVCAEGLTQCGQECVDVNIHIFHCGGCDQPCESGQTCEQGRCVGTSTGGDPSVPVTPTTLGATGDGGACTCSTVGSGGTWFGAVLGALLGLLTLGRRRRG